MKYNICQETEENYIEEGSSPLYVITREGRQIPTDEHINGHTYSYKCNCDIKHKKKELTFKVYPDTQEISWDEKELDKTCRHLQLMLLQESRVMYHEFAGKQTQDFPPESDDYKDFLVIIHLRLIRFQIFEDKLAPPIKYNIKHTSGNNWSCTCEYFCNKKKTCFHINKIKKREAGLQNRRELGISLAILALK